MSLNDKKSALFAKASNSKLETIQPAKVVKSMTGTNPILPPSNNNRAPLIPSTSTSTSTSGYQPSITPDQKAKKLAEAKEFKDQAAKLLETSMFNWNPDYLAAAPLYDRASAIYKGIGDLDQARDMMVQAAVTHKNANCLTAAALAYTKASPIAQSQGRYDLSGMYLEQAAELYAISGDVDRGAECGYKAAVELERVNPNKSLALYEKSVEAFWPSTLRKESIRGVSIRTLEALRNYFSFLLRLKKYPQAIDLANKRLIVLNEVFEMESALFKLLAAVSILYLAIGDVVNADQTFVQIHFGFKGYIASKECEVAENFIMAFKLGDLEKLDKVKASQELTYLELDIQTIARTLTLGDEMDILAARNKTLNLDTIQIPSRPQPPSSQPMPAESSTTATATATSADTADTVVRKPVPGGKQPLVAAGSKDSLFKTKAKPTVESAPVSVAPVSTSAVTPIATKSGGISAPVANSNPFGDDDEEEDNTLQDYYKKLAADLGDTDDNVGSSDYMSQLDQLRIDDEEDQDYENDSYNPVHNGTSTLSSPSSITGKVTTAPVVVAPIVSHNDGALAEFEDDDVDIS